MLFNSLNSLNLVKHLEHLDLEALFHAVKVLKVLNSTGRRESCPEAGKSTIYSQGAQLAHFYRQRGTGRTVYGGRPWRNFGAGNSCPSPSPLHVRSAVGSL
jgi:hypothetical protein